MELAGTGQMWAVPGDSRQHPLPPSISCHGQPGPAGGGLWDGCRSVPGSAWGRRGGAPTGEVWRRLVGSLGPPFLEGVGQRGVRGGRILPAACESLVGLRGDGQSALGQGKRVQSWFLVCFVVFSFGHLFSPSFSKECGGTLKTKGRNPWGGRTCPSPVMLQQGGCEPSVQVQLLQPWLHRGDESPVLERCCWLSPPWLSRPAPLPCNANSPKLPWSCLPQCMCTPWEQQ